MNERIQKYNKYILIVSLVVFSFLFGFAVSKKLNITQGARLENKGSLFQEFPKGEELINKTQPPESVSKNLDFKVFWTTWNAVKDSYYKQPVDEKNLFYGALKGLVAALGDPYSVFLDPKETKEFKNELSDNFEGIGAEIGIKNNQLVIVTPLEGTPAFKAGLRAGYKILKINNEDTSNMSLFAAVIKIRGPKGTKVKLLILHRQEKESKEITITRDTIKVQSVEFKMLKNRIAYIKLSNFHTDTSTEFLKAARETLRKNPKALILDLRNNPGGFLDSAVDIASHFIAKGVIAKQRVGEKNGDEYKVNGRAILKDLKTIVLVNEGSASASEIVAGALQDYKKAIILGEKTFGKGSIQDFRDLEDGSSIKFTIAEWLTPKDRNINEKGIVPDIVVLLTPEDYNNDRDPQLDQAIKLLK